MADIITNVVTVDIQLLDADRSDATTVKLDNPKPNITREQVSAAMQPALVNGWLLTNKGSVAVYLGDITVNQSIKTKLQGQDYYVTPDHLYIQLSSQAGATATGTITISGATIQGFSITDSSIQNDAVEILMPTISENGLSIDISVKGLQTSGGATFNVNLIILGEKITVPCTVTRN